MNESAIGSSFVKTFHPTEEEFGDLRPYIQKIEKECENRAAKVKLFSVNNNFTIVWYYNIIYNIQLYTKLNIVYVAWGVNNFYE